MRSPFPQPPDRGSDAPRRASGVGASSCLREGLIMHSREKFISVFGLLAAAAAAVFLAISIDGHIYAPGYEKFALHLGVRDAIGSRFPQVYNHDLGIERIVRKIYSVVAFAIVGFFASPLFVAKARLQISALLVMGFSLAIEIAQHAMGYPESLVSNAFDLACGALGGMLGALGWNGIAHLAARTRT